MSENQNQPPFRMPCEGISGRPLYFFGSRWQHALSGLKYPRYENSTLVDNPAGGAQIPPYERWTADASGGDSCEVHHCVTDPGALPCLPWPKPFPTNIFVDTGDYVDMTVPRKRGFKNVQARRLWSGVFGFMATNGEPDTIQCCGEATIKSWAKYQAAAPQTKFLALTISAESKEEQFTHDGDGNVTGSTVNWDDTAGWTQAMSPNSGVTTRSGFSADPSDDRNRALALIKDIMENRWTRSQIIGYMTGATDCIGEVDPCHECTDSGITTYGNFSGTIVPIEVLAWDIAGGSFSRKKYVLIGSTNAQYFEETITLTDSSLSYSKTDSTLGSWGDVIDPTATTTEMVTAGYSGSNTSASLLQDIKNNLLSLWPLNADWYPWRTDNKVGLAPRVARDEILANAFTDDVYVKDYGNPIANDTGLHVGDTIGDANWDEHCGVVLAPDANSGTMIQAISIPVSVGTVINITVNGFGYTDEVPAYSTSGTLPPGVSFNSSTGVISGTSTADGHFGITVTSSVSIPAANGAIVGAPLTPGYENPFDFAFMDMRGCCFRPDDNPGFQAWSWYLLGWGMDVDTFNSNSGAQIPLNATKWNNWWEAAGKPAGAWIFHADKDDYYGSGCVSSDAPSKSGDSAYIVAQKWAEIKDDFPSQNFGMPAGDAKFWFDEDRVCCAVNASGTGEGSTWTLTDPTTGLPPSTLEIDNLWGGPVVGGFYALAGYDGGTGVVTLGAKHYDVPSNWASKSDVGAIDLGDGEKRDEDFCFGPLRWQDAPAILGRESVAWVSNESPIMIILENKVPSLMTGDSVDISEIHSITAANGTFTVTRIDDKTFTLDGTTGNLTALFLAVASPAGLLTTGNIDINNRPLVPNGDDISTVDSATIEEAGMFILIPLVNDVTRTIMSGPDATTWYHSTGKHLGKFDTNANAEAYAIALHEQQEATYAQEGWVSSHGASKYYFNDTGAKGDYTVLEWESDFRSLGEYTRLTGMTDCSDTQIARPTANAGGGPIGSATQFKAFIQTQCCLPFTPCSPRVICISPNGETWPNGKTYDFPASFIADEDYGSKWWKLPLTVMTDLFWQRPHRPCNIESCASWIMDDATCHANEEGSCPATEEAPAPKYYYAMAPQVEARLAIPSSGDFCSHTYGPGQDEPAPALPDGIQIGWLSPVDHDSGDVALPPVAPTPEADTGRAGGANTTWLLHAALCESAAGGCRFNYNVIGCTA